MQTSRNPKVLNKVLKYKLRPILDRITQLEGVQMDNNSYIQNITSKVENMKEQATEELENYKTASAKLDTSLGKADKNLSNLIKNTLYNPNSTTKPGTSGGSGESGEEETKLITDKSIDAACYGLVIDGKDYSIYGVTGKGIAIGENPAISKEFIWRNPANDSKPFPSYYVNDILFIDTNTVMIATNNGIVRYSMKEEEYTVMDKSFGLPHNIVYKVIKVKGAEGDDVVATLSEYSKEPVMVISEDKDFIQLLRLPNVVLYKPIKKEFIQNVSESAIKDKLRLHILVGDRGDNIPSIMEETRFNPEFIKFCQDNNIYEDDVLKFKTLEISNTLIDLFMSKNKGKSIYKPARFGEKTAEKYLVNLKENLLNDKLAMNNYKRNMILIDFEYIPKDIKESIIKEYENCKLNSDLEKLLRFFLKYDCEKHADQLNLFIAFK